MLATAGQPAAIRLTPDRRNLTADGQELAFVAVQAVALVQCPIVYQ